MFVLAQGGRPAQDDPPKVETGTKPGELKLPDDTTVDDAMA